MIKKEMTESGKIFALSMVLLNGLFLTAIIGVFWLVQIVLAQINEISALLYGFRA